jgi:hypothetical protein
MNTNNKQNPWIPKGWVLGLIIGGFIILAIFIVIILLSMDPGVPQCGGPLKDIGVMKLDADGNIQWQTRIDSGMDDVGETILQVPDGGSVISFRSDDRNGLRISNIIRLNNDGSTEWQRHYSQYTGLVELYINPDGGFFTETYPWKILLLDDQGNVTREIPYGSDEFSSYFIPRGNRGFYTIEQNLHNRRSTLSSIDNNGSLIWQAGNKQLVAITENSLLVTSDGGCIVSGYMPNMSELTYLRFDSTGNERWNITLSRSRDNRPITVVEIQPGVFEIQFESARYSETFGKSVMDTYSVTYDDNGTEISQRILDVSRQESFNVKYYNRIFSPWQKIGIPSEWGYEVNSVPTLDGGRVVLVHLKQVSQESCHRV